jgi:uncharacterized protein YndB with AHSA1/START domain
MAAVIASIEINASVEKVFDYAIDPANLAAWQENVVSASQEGELAVGGKVITVRRLGKREQPMTLEFTSYDAPHAWSMRGVDGPVRPLVATRIERTTAGSRVTVELDFEGRGIGKLLVPLLVRPETRKGLPRNLELLKKNLEV